MNSYIRWVLRHEHQGCSAPIPVPSPIHTGAIADLGGWPKPSTTAAFLCSECGLVMSYSESDLQNHILETPDPYLHNVLDLVGVEAECGDSSCKSRKQIHAVWDVAKSNLATTIPMSEWRFDDSVQCGNGHPVRLRLRLGEGLPYYRAQMPF